MDMAGLGFAMVDDDAATETGPRMVGNDRSAIAPWRSTFRAATTLID
jgi:hypothetical protein